MKTKANFWLKVSVLLLVGVLTLGQALPATAKTKDYNPTAVPAPAGGDVRVAMDQFQPPAGTTDLSLRQIKDKNESKKSLAKLKTLSPGKDYANNELLVRAASSGEADRLAALYGAKVKSYSKHGFAVLSLGDQGKMLSALSLSAQEGNGYPALFPNYIYHVDMSYKPDYTASDPGYTQQFFHTDMGNRYAWNITRGSADVVVAVLDTGIDITHPEFAGKLDPRAYNASNKSVGLESVVDYIGHGTHVAGIIAALQNNGVGGCGTAPGVTLLPIKLNEENFGFFTTDAMLEGLYYAADAGAEIVNMSLGRPYEGGPSLMEREAVLYAASKGCLLVSSAGNDSLAHAGYPAVYTQCLAVSALMKGNAFDGSYSNYGPEIDLSAPGTEIYSTYLKNGYETYSGTSMAAPNVCGAAALILSKNPNLSGDDVKQILISTATDKGASGRDDYYGSGAVNTAGALSVMGTAPYQITFDSQGGSPVQKRTAYRGTLLLAPESPWREGYVFDGWCKDAQGQEPWQFSKDLATGNLVLYARWAQEPNRSVEQAPSAALEDSLAGKIDFPKDRDYYLFTPAVSMRYFFEYAGAVPMDAHISSYSTDEETLDSLRLPQEMLTNGDGYSMVTATLEAGKTYVLCLDGTGSTLGDYTVTVYKGYDVTLNLNSVETTQTFTFPVAEGGTLLQFADISGIKTEKTGYAFGGWCTTRSDGYEWNLEDGIVEKNLTLYARWVSGKSFPSGTGLPEDPYHIETKYQLSLVDCFPESSFVLDRDLAFTAADFAVDGPYYYGGEYWKPLCSQYGYYGTFNGRGHTISGLKVDTFGTNDAMAGLFCAIREKGVVQDLAMVGCDIRAEAISNYAMAGSIAGQLVGGSIINCYNTGAIDAEAGNIANSGGIVGHSFVGIIKNCFNFGVVNTDASGEEGPTCNAGGIIGEAAQVEILSCVNTGTVTSGMVAEIYGGGGSKAGGIVGYYYGQTEPINGYKSMLRGCTNRGSVMAMAWSPPDAEYTTAANGGGIVGKCSGPMEQCANAGAVKSMNYWYQTFAGGIAGSLYAGTCTDSFNTGTVDASTDYLPMQGIGYATAGGVAGQMWFPEARMDNCYNRGVVTEDGGNASVQGGIVGDASSESVISDSYFLDITAYGTGCYSQGGATILTEEQFKQSSSFVGFDFTGKWQIGGNPLYPYPELRSTRNLIPYNSLILADTKGKGFYQVLGVDGSGFVQLPATPTQTGYKFNRWYQDSACTDPWDFATEKATGPMTLYGGWTPNRYTVQFYPTEGTGTMASQTMEYGIPEALNLCTFKKTGYPFRYWEGETMGGYTDGQVVESLTSVDGATYKLYAAWGGVAQSVKSASYTSLTVNWAGIEGAGAYVINRSTSINTGYTKVATVSASARSWTNTGLVTGKTYFYRVYPVINGKTYVNTDAALAKPIPATPAATVTKASTTALKVAWGGVSGASKYQVYRANSINGTYSLVYTGSATSRSWTNTGLSGDTYYYYKVRAIHLEGTAYVYGGFSGVRYYGL